MWVLGTELGSSYLPGKCCTLSPIPVMERKAKLTPSCSQSRTGAKASMVAFPKAPRENWGMSTGEVSDTKKNTSFLIAVAGSYKVRQEKIIFSVRVTEETQLE